MACGSDTARGHTTGRSCRKPESQEGSWPAQKETIDYHLVDADMNMDVRTDTFYYYSLALIYLWSFYCRCMQLTVCGLCHLHGTMSRIADKSLLDAWLILKDEVLEAWSPLGALGHVGKIDGGLLLSNEACATPSRRASNGHSSVW